MADLPIIRADKPVWVYANVTYALEEPVTSAGYYYQVRCTDRFVVSSLMLTASSADLVAAGVRATLQPTMMIESFEGDWQQEWFSYHDGWGLRTHKVYDSQWHAPDGAKLAFQVSSAEPNKLVVGVDDYAAELSLSGGSAWEAVQLSPGDFKNAAGQPLNSFVGIKELRLNGRETLRGNPNVTLGSIWKGVAPVFNDLHWVPSQQGATHQTSISSVKRQPDVMWTYKEVDGQQLQLSVFPPDGYANATVRFPAFVVYHGGS